MSTPRISGSILKLIALFALALGIYSLLTAMYIWMRFHVHFPVKDILHLMPFVQDVLNHGYLSPSASDWLHTHAMAHRIAVTRLALVIDFQFFGGQNHFIYFTGWLSLLALLWVLVAAFRKSYKSEPVILVFVVGIALIFLTSQSQSWNLVNPINNSWYVAMAASALAIFLVAKEPDVPTGLSLVLVCLLAVVSAWSNFSGVIVCLMLPVLIGIRSTRAGLLAAAITGTFLFFYLPGIIPDLVEGALGLTTADEPPQGVIEQLKSDAANQLMKFLVIFSKTCSYLGSPLSIHHPVAAILLVVCSFGLLVKGWWELLKLRFRGSPRYNSWLETTVALATVILGIALATHLGRVYYSQPTAERYQTVVMVYWFCISGLILYFGLKARNEFFGRAVSTLLCIGLAALLPLNSTLSLGQSLKLAETASRVSSLALLDVIDDVDDHFLTPRSLPTALRNLNPYLKATQTGYWYNVPREIKFESAEICGAIVARVKPSNWPGISLAAIRIQDQWSKWYRHIPVSTAQGKVIGFLSPVYKKGVTVPGLYSSEENGWTGYFRTDEIKSEDLYLHFRVSPFAGTPCRLTM